MWDEMSSLWSYEESHDMEQLGEKLMCTTLELEKLKAEAMEEMKRNRDYIKQLIHLLKFAIQERDEARAQFQNLLLIKSSAAAETLALPAAKPNSSITESNSPSETYNFHSHSSTPVDSFFDAVASPEFSDINFLVASDAADQSSMIIDTIAKGRALPQKGKLLQSVLQAGPLLQNLLLAGPLPRWRNPPQIQPFHIPPFAPPDLQFPAKPYAQMSCGTSSPSPLLSFANLGPSSPAMNVNGYAPQSMSPPGADSSRWDPQVIGIVGLICSIFLLFSYYKILERNCATFRVIRLSRVPEQRRRLNQHLEDFSSQLQSRGLDSFAMHSLPITQIKKGKDEEPNPPGTSECAVGLGEFEDGEWVKKLPICCHVFHVSCIDTWFQTHSSCPLCRACVCEDTTPRESPINMNFYLETLSREDFHRETLPHVQITVEPRR